MNRFNSQQVKNRSRSSYAALAAVALVGVALALPVNAASGEGEQSKDQKVDALESRVKQLEKALKRNKKSDKKSKAAFEEYRKKIKVNGFFAAGITKLMSDDATYAATVLDIDEDISQDADSKLGIQASFIIDENFQLKTQLLYEFDKSSVDMEWVYLAWNNDSSSVGFDVGKIRTPFYFYSETLEVSHTYPFVRPPFGVYQFPFTSLKGARLRTSYSLGGYSFQTNISSGSTEGAQFDFEFDIDKSYGIEHYLYLGDFTFRLAYQLSDVENDSPAGSLPAQVEQLIAVDLGRPDLVLPDLVQSKYYTGAILYEAYPFYIFAEVAELKWDKGPLSDKTTGMVTIGRYFGKWLPYFTYVKSYTNAKGDRLRTEQAKEIEALLGAGSPIALAAKTLTTQQTDYIVGLRYDYSEKVAMKLEYQHSTDFNGGAYRSGRGDFNDTGLITQGVDVTETLDDQNIISIIVTTVF